MSLKNGLWMMSGREFDCYVGLKKVLQQSGWAIVWLRAESLSPASSPENLIKLYYHFGVKFEVYTKRGIAPIFSVCEFHYSILSCNRQRQAALR